MLFKSLSAAVYGIDASTIDVEVDFRHSCKEDHFHTVGLPDAAVRESRDRVRAAIKNSGYLIFRPPTSPSIWRPPTSRKRARASICRWPSASWAPMARCSVDRPRAISAGRRTWTRRQRARGARACCRSPSPRARRTFRNLILPAANAAEAAVVEGVNVYPVTSLIEVLELLNCRQRWRDPARALPRRDRRRCWASFSTSRSTSRMCAVSTPPSAHWKWPQPAATTS